MRAGWIRRVGVIILFATVTLTAESIPVEYFEGRIVGAHRLGLSFSDSEDGLAVFNLVAGTGLASRFALYTPGALSYTPQNTNDKWELQERISGEAQAGKRVRYSLIRLEHDEDETAQIMNGRSTVQNASTWGLVHELSLWSAGSYELDPVKSVYLMTQGTPWFEAGEYYASIQHGYWKYTYTTDERSIPPYGTSVVDLRRENSNKYPSVTSSARIGLGANLLLTSDFRLTQERYDYSSVWRDSTFWDIPSTTKSESTQRVRLTEGTLDLGLTKFWGAGTWGSVIATIGADDLESEDHDYAEGTGLYSDFNHLDEVDGSNSSARIALGLTCISKPEAKPVQFLLDRFVGYYGQELPSGANTFSALLSWAVNDRSHSASSRDPDGDSIFYTLDYNTHNETTEHQFGADFAHSHFFRRNLVSTIHFSAALTPNLADSPDAYYQNLDRVMGLLALEYRSYLWDPSKRREISWTEIADIDLLLGPLMREDDYRIRFEFEPWRQEYNSRLISPSTEAAFATRQVQLQYSVGLSAIHGLNGEVDISGSVSVRFLSSDDDWMEYDRQYWDIGTSLRWQPTGYLRLSGRLAAQVYNEDSIIKFFGDETSSTTESTTWSLATTIDVVF